MINRIIVYTDGGARGNPGPAAIGVVIEGLSGGVEAFGEYIGKTTNNEAEYRALILALKKLSELAEGEDIEHVECRADSELMIRQLNGEYKVKDSNIRGFFLEIQALKLALTVPVSFHHIPRAQNSAADALVNEVLDNELGPAAV